jgi:hypothetical protein
MTTLQLRAAFFFAGAIASVVWMNVCPKYKDNSTYEMVSGDNGIGKHSEPFEHTEPSMYFGGEIVIWSALIGAYILIQTKQPVSPIVSDGSEL